MPCAIAEPGNYPDYLKKILKEIEVGNDDEANACACNLITPLTDEGCPITVENGKLLAFPFCLDTEPPDVDPNLYVYDLALTYEQAMKFYWARTMKVEYVINASATVSQADGICGSPGPAEFTWRTAIEGSTQLVQTPKQLVCAIGKGARAVGYKPAGIIQEPCGPNETCIILERPATLIHCGIISNYTHGYAGGGAYVFYNGFNYSPESGGYYALSSRGWIDKTNKKIYPYIQGSFNLFGLAGFPIPKNGKWENNGVSFDLITTDIGLNTPIGLNCGTVKMTLK